jgi:hypothetical protein
MANINVTGSALSSNLSNLLMAPDITPGDAPSYQLCKTIYAFHPLGGKMVDTPIELAMSQARKISIPDSPEDRIRDAFMRQWKALKADEYIADTMRTARMYGVAAIVFGAKGVPTERPIDPKTFAKLDLYFNVLDPLNAAGSLVLNQDPNAPDFQKPTILTAAGQKYHASRSCVVMNGRPIYIEYTNSAFGYVGRSTYQRALYPLKSFVQSMVTDDMVTRKAGVIVAKMKQAGSIADKMMTTLAGIKRNVVKEAETDNVISISTDEAIETLDMQNTDTAMTTARSNIINNVAAAADMPAKLLNDESFAEGFGEGTEDAKAVVRYIEGLRKNMGPLYEFFDKIVQYSAWTPEFYATIQADFPEYKEVGYLDAFYRWRNSFTTEWPSLLVEPESKLVDVEKVKLESIVSALEAIMPEVDPANKARLIQWAADNINESKHLFKNPLTLDYEVLSEFVPPEPEPQDGAESFTSNE